MADEPNTQPSGWKFGREQMLYGTLIGTIGIGLLVLGTMVVPAATHWGLAIAAPLSMLGGVGILIALPLLAVGSVRYAMWRTLSTGESPLGHPSADIVRKLDQIDDRLLLSDQAKRIAYRRKDRDALREAIIEDIRKQDYEAALALVDEMAQSFGYREEAEHFRDQILDAQAKRKEQLIDRAIADIDAICDRYEWDEATKQAEKLRRTYPEVRRVQELPKRVDHARETRKSELEREFLDAAERDDVERALELMTELDQYLTPEEAEPYLETARGVVGKKRMNLGVQFKLAIQDRDWMQAVQVGEQLIREFPNSKMAEEVRSMLDVIRERAQAQRAAGTEQTTG